ncbi:phage head morphogenesis protein [Spartinivicinus ruber]|uniref:phage head morphogenesis protein n=1 Tax=Spartinivicinus ruber TaxID=2683272 RepID=UPI0013D35446|nr:phage minor head protein [Spartinivicinus ruber]
MHFAFNREQKTGDKQDSDNKTLSEALSYFRDKGIKISWDYREVWKAEHTHAFTVSKAMCQDVLLEIKAAVDKALTEGIPFETFQKELMPFLQRRGWVGIKIQPDGTRVELGSPRRLKIIYDTNMRVSRAAGQWARMQRTKKVMPYLLYSLGPSKEHRLQHERWAGLVLPIDDVFWNTHFPPNGWGCKCRVRQVTKREATRRGLSPLPEINPVRWTNQYTGRTEMVPEGIDPGWNYNPGQSRSQWLKKYAQEKEKEFQAVFG